MTELEKIQRYIDRTKIDPTAANGRQMRFDEVLAINNTTKYGGAIDAICLAFDFGMAKGYRLAKAEAKSRKQ